MSSLRLWSEANFTLRQSRRCLQSSPLALRHYIILNDYYLGIQPYSLLLNKTRYHGSRVPPVRPTETNEKIRPGQTALFSSSAANTNAHELDLVIIGAGTSGIAAGKFYLDIHPKSKVAILERDNGPGGVWNHSRSYEHFWTQTAIGLAEFSDMPMACPPNEDTHHEFFKSKHTTQYLEKYIDHHRFAGRSLRDRIVFNFTVDSITKLEGKWFISGRNSSMAVKEFCAKKVIVASGLTSVPNIPTFPGKDLFEGTILHQLDFGQSRILSSPQVKHVTVLGGAKSAADMVYESVKAGKSVSWVIRASGTGPGFFSSAKSNAKSSGPYKNQHEIASTRMVATLTPTFFNNSWWMKFLHGTRLGTWLVSKIWAGIDSEVRRSVKSAASEALEGFKNLEHHTPVFWQNGAGILINIPDFWHTITPSVRIYNSDIVSLSRHHVHLEQGASLPSNVIFCGTGWSSTLSFFTQETLAKLGLPHSLSQSQPSVDEKEWEQLEQKADQKVLTRFPMLANPPPHYHKIPKTTPYRLYKSIAPLSDHSIAFVGHVMVANYFRLAEVQAIWATAYLDERLTLPPLHGRKEQIAEFVAWCRRRYLSNGEKGNWMAFEQAGYTDNLLSEVGLKTHRKGWWKDFWAPARPEDFRGLRDEYVRMYGGG